MDATALEGGFADPAAQSARAFRACLDVMARPGTVQALAGARPPAPLSPAAGTVLLTLADATTPVYLAGALDRPEIRDWITFHTGAPLTGAANATFALGAWADLLPLDRFALGTAEYPDRSATLIVEMAALEPPTHRLTGPGIRDAAELALPGEEAARLNDGAFPLGLDLILTCGERLAAVPRTTQLEAL
ncbi:phosphonate C-P lyase system protein PhnH [Acidimangrovimonas pyrenivorans]|uniref:Phosphonate C-P lyase system protein PhnH n=1 Tax=Acidimangrovimonas pyrenivorans TaxID=2030798 RepID=A0ABV7AGT9_9RHOB